MQEYGSLVTRILSYKEGIYDSALKRENAG